MIKKLLSILVLSLLFEGNAYAKICNYDEVLNKINGCDRKENLIETLNEKLFFDLLKPKDVSIEDWKNLIKKRIKEWDDGAEQRNKEYEAQRKKEVDLRCEILAGQANNTSSARKIYKKCMKAEGY